jgi:hypothetical protein
MSELGTLGTGPVSQSRAGGLYSNGTEFEPDTGDEHAVIEACIAPMLVWARRLRTQSVLIPCPTNIGVQVLDGRILFDVLSLEMDVLTVGTARATGKCALFARIWLPHLRSHPARKGAMCGRTCG